MPLSESSYFIERVQCVIHYLDTEFVSNRQSDMKLGTTRSCKGIRILSITPVTLHYMLSRYFMVNGGQSTVLNFLVIVYHDRS